MLLGVPLGRVCDMCWGAWAVSAVAPNSPVGSRFLLPSGASLVLVHIPVIGAEQLPHFFI